MIMITWFIIRERHPLILIMEFMLSARKKIIRKNILRILLKSWSDFFGKSNFVAFLLVK